MVTANLIERIDKQLKGEKILPTPIFSFFQNGIKNTIPNGEITLNDFMEMIKEDTPLLQEIRASPNKEERDKLKSKLGYVTFAGTFEKRANNKLKESSGLVCLDYDGIEDLEGIKNKLMEDEYTHCIFISPSGKGLKLLVKIPKVENNEEYKSRWSSIAHHYNISGTDEGTKDISRACFLSYDPEPFFNPNSEIYENIRLDLEETTKKLIAGEKYGFLGKKVLNSELFKDIEKIIKNSGLIAYDGTYKPYKIYHSTTCKPDNYSKLKFTGEDWNEATIEKISIFSDKIVYVLDNKKHISIAEGDKIQLIETLNNNKKEFEKLIGEKLKIGSEEFIEKINQPEIKKEDTSRSGLEYRKVLALLRKGKSRTEIYEEMKAYSKWSSAPEQYRSLTFEKAEDFYLQEQEKKETPKEPEKTLELDKNIFQEVKKIISKYIDTTPQNIEILSLWLLGTYFHKDFETFPLLQFIAQKRSGKSRSLKLLSSLSSGSDGSVSTSPTETLLFRHKEGALFFDEMENISSKERGAFRETLNAVYKKGNKITRYKEVKKDGVKDYVEEFFYPYYPLGLANISGFGDVLGDRAVQIILRRSNKRLTKLVEDFSTNKDVLFLKKKLFQLKATIPENFFSDWNNYIEEKELQKKELKYLFDKINETKIYGRSLEIFFPLFIISYLCENLDDFLKTAKDYVLMKEEEEAVDDVDERVKDFINKRWEVGFVNQSTLLEDFKNGFEIKEDWVNSKWFGRALKRLDLIKQKRLVNGKVQIILNNNSTNTTNTINTINPTNTTKDKKEVEIVELVDSVELGGLVERDKKEWISEMKSLGWSDEDLKEAIQDD